MDTSTRRVTRARDRPGVSYSPPWRRIAAIVLGVWLATTLLIGTLLLRITYDPAKPTYSCNCHPDDLAQGTTWFRNTIGGLWLGLVPTAVTGIALGRCRRHR